MTLASGSTPACVRLPTSNSTTTASAPDFANMSLNTTAPNAGAYSPKANGKLDLTSDLRAPRTATSSSPNMGSFVTKGEGIEENGDIDPSRKLTKRSTTQYEDQNAKWYKAAKKAEKKSGVPHVHLAC